MGGADNHAHSYARARASLDQNTVKQFTFQTNIGHERCYGSASEQDTASYRLLAELQDQIATK